jgi:hypothetical protein
MNEYIEPRLGNRSDAIALLEELIEMTSSGAVDCERITLHLKALKDVMEREIV